MNKKNNDDKDYKHSKEIKTSIKNLSKDMNKSKNTFATLQAKYQSLKRKNLTHQNNMESHTQINVSIEGKLPGDGT